MLALHQASTIQNVLPYCQILQLHQIVDIFHTLGLNTICWSSCVYSNLVSRKENKDSVPNCLLLFMNKKTKKRSDFILMASLKETSLPRY